MSTRTRRKAKPTQCQNSSTDRFENETQREVMKYANGVVDGSVVAGSMIVKACQRFLNDLKNGHKRDLAMDWNRADNVVRYMQLMKHSTGEFDGKLFLLQPWQKFIMANIFGWKRANGFRRFRTAYISVGRGNGKSPMAALILMALFFIEEFPEARAQMKIAAFERAQARIVFDEFEQFLNQQPRLNALTERFKNRINHVNGSHLEPLGKESGSKDGYNLHSYVADEIHAWKEEHREMLEKLETAMGKRRQPLAVWITTAGSDKSKIWNEKDEYAQSVLNGLVDDDSFFIAVYRGDEKDDPHDETTWIKGSPNYGISVKPDYLKSLSAQAKVNPAKLHELIRYHVNRLVRSKMKMIDPDVWAKGKIVYPDLRGLHCCGGLDLGFKDDIASFVLCWVLKPADDEPTRYAMRSWNWICEHTKHRDLSRPPWKNWIDAGYLTVTPGNSTDWPIILEKIKQLGKLYKPVSIALDPHNARVPGNELINEGFNVFDFQQSSRKYNEPTRELLTLIEDERLIHNGDPLLSFAAGNVTSKIDSAGLIMPDKMNSSEKIDPIVAGIMALSEVIFTAEDTTLNPYEYQSVREF